MTMPAASSGSDSDFAGAIVPREVAAAAGGGADARVPLPGWATELARAWNSGAHSLFILQGNIHDLFAVNATEHVPLGAFLRRRLFPQRSQILHYDVGAGLTFATSAMQTRFFEWLAIYDEVEHTSFHRDGLPQAFNPLRPILRRFFQRMADEMGAARGLTLVINYPEKVVPAADEAQAGADERVALVTMLSWAASTELRRGDIGIVLVTESIAELHADLLQNPHVARARIDLPTLDERRAFVASGRFAPAGDDRTLTTQSDLSVDELARRTAGLPLLRIEQLIATALRNDQRLTAGYITAGKRRLIEEYCGDLVTFKDPKLGRSLDLVATHAAAKTRLRELAQLIRDGHHAVVERGVLVPGRVGVGKSFLIDCFASECGLPVLELGQFRSKWVGETERQQARILLTIRALGPVIVVVDEADAVFGNRSADGDSGVSSRVFAAFAAHLGDNSLRGRELWIAMTSRPDLMAIDLKRQGRFGLCVPLFPAQNADEVVELFDVIGRSQGLALTPELLAFARETLGDRSLTGSDIEAILVRARERAVLAGETGSLSLADLGTAVETFIDPLDENLLALQELAAVLACSDRRFLPPRYAEAERSSLRAAYDEARRMIGRAG